MQLTRKKIFKYALTVLLVTGVILALGFLSFTGMLALCGLVGVAIGSFAVTAMIEGEVYAQSIVQGIEKLFKGKWLENKHLKNALYIHELNKLLKSYLKKNEIDKESLLAPEMAVKSSVFLKQYSEHVATLEKLKHKKEKLGLLLFYFFSDEFKQAFENAEKLVQEDQKYFIALMERNSSLREAVIATPSVFCEGGSNPEKNQETSLLDCHAHPALAMTASREQAVTTEQDRVDGDSFLALGMTAKRLAKINTNISKKSAISPWCLTASTIAGAGMGLVFFSVAPESIVATAAFFGVTLSATAFPVGITVAVAVLAAMAAIGYSVLVYNTLTDMSQHDVVKKWIKKIKDFFSLPKGEMTAAWVAKKVFGALAIALLVAVCVFATITTAGTWWYAAKAGITFILPQLETLAVFISTAVAAVMGIGQLGFNLKNSLKTAGIVKKNVVEFFQNVNTEFIKTCFNQSTLKKKYYDQERILKFVNPFRALTVIIEWPFRALAFLGHIVSSAVMGDRCDPIPAGASAAAGAIVEGTSDGAFFMDDHKHHDHSHTDIAGKILFVVLSPVYLLSALWDFGCSLPELEEFTRETIKKAAKESFIKSFFGIDAWNVLSKERAIVSKFVNEQDYKKASASKIVRILDNEDRVEELKLTLPEKDSFINLSRDLDLSNNLLHDNNENKSYAEIFRDAKKNPQLQSENAQNFLAKVECFKNPFGKSIVA